MRSGNLLWVGMAVGLVAIAPARDTSACGNEVELRLTPAKLVADGEKLIAEGKARGAMDHVRAGLNNGQPLKFGENGLIDRGLIVAARAVVRSDGELEMLKGTHVDAKKEAPPVEGGPTQRVKNLSGALETLKAAAAKKGDDPVAQTDLGEALARIPGQEAEAKKILEALEDKGVMASAWGYAALAQLRAQTNREQPSWLSAALVASEQAPRTVALERCSKMAARKEICTGEKLADAMTKVPLPPSEMSRSRGRGLDSRE
ncbi:MAG: hypothetical protein IPM79_33520 [Polyangiaceae bacterium]|jgi:hypothetical protein|nr:hypothetical protein [Polyangiaceae bacterium]MBK8942389.1 hypothetical protein [Polyangiaceae bacterium]